MRIDQLRRDLRIFERRFGASSKRRMGAGGRNGQQRGAQRPDAEADRRRREHRQNVVGHDDSAEPGAGRVDFRRKERDLDQTGGAQPVQIDAERKPVAKRRRRPFVVVAALVEQDQRCLAAGVQRLCQPGRQTRGAAFGHRQHQPDRLAEQAARAHHGPGAQRGGDVDAAEQLHVLRVGADLARGPERIRKPFEKGRARRPGPRPQVQPAQPARVDRQQRERQLPGHPGFARIMHHAKTSSTVRMTRVPEPASSSGSRRNR